MIGVPTAAMAAAFTRRPRLRLDMEAWEPGSVGAWKEAGRLPCSQASYSPWYRFNSSVPFVPPKPKEFDRAYSIAIDRFTFGA